MIARCAESTKQRPITIRGMIAATPGSAFEKELQDFVTYGAPVTTPEGAFTGVLDAPGGLGGPIEGAALSIAPVDDAEPGDDRELRLEVLAPDRTTVLAGIDAIRTQRSEGLAQSGQGLRVVLTDVDGMLEIEHRFNFADGQMSQSVRMSTFEGRPIARARQMAQFLLALHEPNVLRSSLRGTPPELGIITPQTGVTRSEAGTQRLEVAARVFADLEEIQRHTPIQVRAPELGRTSLEELATWFVAAELLRGNEVVETYPADEHLWMDLAAETEVPAEGEIHVLMPFTVTVSGRVIDLGQKLVTLPGVAIHERRPSDHGSVLHRVTTTDRKISQLGPVDADDLPDLGDAD